MLSKRNWCESGLETSSPKWLISCICFFCHSAQHSLHISSPIFCPSSVGTGAYPIGSLFAPQRAHLNLSPNKAMGRFYHSGNSGWQLATAVGGLFGPCHSANCQPPTGLFGSRRGHRRSLV